MSSIQSLRKIAGLSRIERRLILQAMVLLLIFKISIAILPFRKIAKAIRLMPGEATLKPEPDRPELAERIGWAVRASAGRMPSGSTCLAQALAGIILLRRNGLPGTLYLGVSKAAGPSGTLLAHAWLRCGNLLLTGAGGHERFKIISTFHNQ